MKGLNMENIAVFDEVLGLSAFDLLVHEVREGFYQGAGIKNDLTTFSPTDAYPSSHWQGLLDQAKSANIDFIQSDAVQYNPPKSYREDGAILTITYKKAKNGTYTKTTYEIRMEHGKFVRDDKGKLVYTKKTENISAAKYAKEKRDAKAKFQKMAKS